MDTIRHAGTTGQYDGFGGIRGQLVMQPGNIFDYTYTGNAVEGSYAKEVVRIKICGSQAMKRISWFYLKRRARGGASKEWEEWTVRATAPSLCPSQVPSPVSEKNCKTPRALASRLYRLLSGHAMTGPFLKKKRGGLRGCWCETRVERSREHLKRESLGCWGK